MRVSTALAIAAGILGTIAALLGLGSALTQAQEEQREEEPPEGKN